MAGKRILLVGSGGREHSVACSLVRSAGTGKLFVAPGNGGTGELGENVPIAATEIDKLADFAEVNRIDRTIVTSDDPLALGIADLFRERGLWIWGPTRAAAAIEWSKPFAKDLMRDAGVPTADFAICHSHREALAEVRHRGAPVVVKAGGLALGKGAYVCLTVEAAEEALRKIMIERVHGDAGNEVVVEEFLDGPEVSLHALSDGWGGIALFPTAQDHKPVGEGDTGENTGGMGVIAPVPWVTPLMLRDAEDMIVRPILRELARKGRPFVGCLYPGLKWTKAGWKVLEFNARPGDPEMPAYLRLLKTDLLRVLEACVEGTLDHVTLEWRAGSVVNLVLASGGYPGKYEKGFPITGIHEANRMPGVEVYHAGTKFEDGVLKTWGGRVLGVTAWGDSLEEALGLGYEAAELIHFAGKQYRRDIGAKSLALTV